MRLFGLNASQHLEIKSDTIKWGHVHFNLWLHRLLNQITKNLFSQWKIKTKKRNRQKFGKTQWNHLRLMQFSLFIGSAAINLQFPSTFLMMSSRVIVFFKYFNNNLLWSFKKKWTGTGGPGNVGWIWILKNRWRAMLTFRSIHVEESSWIDANNNEKVQKSSIYRCELLHSILQPTKISNEIRSRYQLISRPQLPRRFEVVLDTFIPPKTEIKLCKAPRDFNWFQVFIVFFRSPSIQKLIHNVIGHKKSVKFTQKHWAKSLQSEKHERRSKKKNGAYLKTKFSFILSCKSNNETVERVREWEMWNYIERKSINRRQFKANENSKTFVAKELQGSVPVCVQT